MFFEYPYLLWLEVVPVLLLALYAWREWKERRPHLRVSTIAPWKTEGGSALALLRHLPALLRAAALSLVIVAIARPRSSTQMEKVDTEGIDIVLARRTASVPPRTFPLNLSPSVPRTAWESSCLPGKVTPSVR